MDLNAYIDLYCERTQPGLWAEPLNAFTNISFFIAAFFVFRLARDKKSLDVRAFALIALLLVVGAGSTLFHVFATHWAMLSDTLPTLLFQLVFLLLYARGVIGLSWPYTVMLLCGFVLCIYGFGTLPGHWLNGSLSYAPAFIFLLGLGAWHRLRIKREKHTLLAAAGVFAISLAFRSLDMEFCDIITTGLHFVWHLLNGVVLYLSARAFLLGFKR